MLLGGLAWVWRGLTAEVGLGGLLVGWLDCLGSCLLTRQEGWLGLTWLRLAAEVALVGENAAGE